MSLRTTILTSALASAVVLASCSGTNKKKTNYVGDAGAAGEEPSGGAGDTGGSVGAAGAAGAAGSAPEGGMGGQTAAPPDAGSGGEAGAPVIVPPAPLPTVLFTVAPGAVGLPGTAIASQPHPASVIFGSATANVDPISGTNTVIVTAAQLGIAEGDVISAFALPQAVPVAATYVFSTAAGNHAGQVPTRLDRSSSDNEAPGDAYFSDGTLSYHDAGGESGAPLGYNALVADEQTLGISATPHGEAQDDLTGIQLLPSGVLSTAIYFAVSANSVGAPGTAVAAASAATRGCTVFKSNRDGTNSAVTTCAQLGLGDGAQLKGLTIYLSADGSETLFTLENNSTGLAETAVAAVTSENVENNIYASAGDNTNELRVAGVNLGLRPSDAIDALAVYDRASAYYGYKSQCELAPTPSLVPDSNINFFESAHGIGDHLLLLNGQSNNADPTVDVILAYDVTTCQLVSKVTLPLNTLGQGHWAPVPLAGWSAADPLKNIEYWQVDPGDGQANITRFSAAGANLGQYAFSEDFSPDRLDYDPIGKRMFTSGGRTTGSFTADYDRFSFTLPPSGAPNTTIIPVLKTPIPHPCANQPRFSGTDAAGNAVYAQHDLSNSNSYRVCSLTPTGELADLPATWQEASGYAFWGLLVPGVAMYSLSTYTGYLVVNHPLGLPPLPTTLIPPPPNTGL